MRLLISWLVGISAAFLLFWLGFSVADELNLRTYVDWEETRITYVDTHYGNVDEDDGETTPLGFWITVMSIIIATRIGMSVYYGNLSGKFGLYGNLELLLVIAFVSLWALLSSLLDIFFGDEVAFFSTSSNWFYNSLKILVACGCGYLWYLSQEKLGDSQRTQK